MDILIFAILVVAFDIWLASRMFSIKATTKTMAKIQLKKYKELTRGKQLSHEEKHDAYLKIIQSRAGLAKDRDEAYEVIGLAHDLASKRDGFLDAEVNLVWVVIAMWAKEQSAHGKRVSGDSLTKVYRAVRSVISKTL